jgi:hypothetical protein
MAHVARLENDVTDRMMDYLDKHDGKKWRYRYFTRPMLNFMILKPVTRAEAEAQEELRWNQA